MANPYTSIDLQTACRMGDLSSIKQAHQSCPSKINEKDSGLGWCPLYRTVICGHFEATEYLLKQGADPNIPNNLGETPLHQAADNSLYSMAELLLKNKANPNYQQNDGDSPLHHAAFRGDLKMVELILKSAGDPNLHNYMFGRTPLHYAVDCGHADCVKTMLQYGADSSLRDKQGKNAMDLCTSIEISNILRQFTRISLESLDIPSPIGEVTTYIVSENGENDKNTEGKAQALKCSLVSPVAEKSSMTCQLYPIYNWLEKYHLEDYYELLVEAGYDDIKVMISQMNGPMPISDRDLKDIGITKPGHRRYMIIKLEEEAGLSNEINIKKHIREKSVGIFKCCNVSNGTKNFSSPGLLEWLESLELSHLFGLFTESGYDTYDLLLDVQNSLHPLTSKQLECEVKIINLKDRIMILNRLEHDINLYYQDGEQSKIHFDEPRKIVCETCCVF
ncbi:hypothetical protein SteCoe_18055 [Stentor coeruleus]|uniref:NAD(+) ADP-ribosyltransferase n=1 Tax=Stentor coeruleus TaxID=5963 RepID=A0A1R2BXZ1_9CILI|nr:hypothetical protein SteCoe_18055 [Stentor coeruleus]